MVLAPHDNSTARLCGVAAGGRRATHFEFGADAAVVAAGGSGRHGVWAGMGAGGGVDGPAGEAPSPYPCTRHDTHTPRARPVATDASHAARPMFGAMESRRAGRWPSR